MKCTILKSFPYSIDGNKNEALHPGGEDREIRDELVAGLKAAGYIMPVSEQKMAHHAVEIPEIVQALEDKMIYAAPENKMDVTPHRERRRGR